MRRVLLTMLVLLGALACENPPEDPLKRPPTSATGGSSGTGGSAGAAGDAGASGEAGASGTGGSAGDAGAGGAG